VIRMERPTKRLLRLAIVATAFAVLASSQISAQADSMMMSIVNGSGAAAPPGCTYAVDTAVAAGQTPAAALSMGRKLKSTYSGNAFKLALSGGSTQEIGFVSGSPCPVPDTATAATFCGTPITNCHVVQPHDQSGNGCDPIQSTWADAPVYDPTGQNSLPTADASGGGATGFTNCTLSAGVSYATFFVVANLTDCTSQEYASTIGPSNGVPGLALSWDNTGGWTIFRSDGTIQPNGKQDASTCPGATDAVIQTTSAVATGWVNGSIFNTPDTSTVTIPSETAFVLWNRSDAAKGFRGQFAEMIVFQSISGCDPTVGGNICKTIRDNQIAASGGWNAP
jgi:Alpha-L-arabinofuranosidase B, catalytic